MSAPASDVRYLTSATVGVVVAEPSSPLFDNAALPRLLRAVGDELSRLSVQMVLFAPQTDDDVERLLDYLAAGHVDAVMLLTPSISLPVRLRPLGLPVVLAGKPEPDAEVSFVDVDNHLGARRATEHLIEQGRRRIGHIGGPAHLTSSREQLQGFREATWNAALRSDLVENGNMDRDSGEMAIARLLNVAEDIDAVFAASDAMAAGAMWAMQTLGRRVPDDVAIIGFDDSPLAAHTQPPLSSVRRPVEDMAREMARLIVGMTESGETSEPQRLILDTPLAVRESTRSIGW